MITPAQIKEAEEYAFNHASPDEMLLTEAYLAALTGPSVSELVRALENILNSAALKEAPFYNYSNAVLEGIEALQKFRGTP